MSLIEDLRKLVGDDSVLDTAQVAERTESLSSTLPRRAAGLVRPRTAQDISRILKYCNSVGRKVAVQGGMGGNGGAVSTENEVAISLERMSAIEEIDPVSRVAVVQAGCILQTFQEAVNAKGFYYGVDYAGRGSATLGGNISTNAGGQTVLRYGMTRDQILGLEVVLADGTILSAMNRMLKNNAGYDLKQLFIGTEGTLGIVTRAVVRLRPLPTSENSALVALSSFDNVQKLLTRCEERFGGILTSFEVMWQAHYRYVTEFQGKAPMAPDYPFYVLIEVRGFNPASDKAAFDAAIEEALNDGIIVDGVVPKSHAERQAIWEPRENMRWAAVRRYDWAQCVDLSLPIRHMERYIADLQRNMLARWPKSELFVFGHIADGNLHVFAYPGSAEEEDLEACATMAYEPLSALGGSIAAEHGIAREKVDFLHYAKTAGEIELMRRLKRMMDPNNILNPGRVIVLDDRER